MCGKTLVGLIIGNIPDARERNNPDINWVLALVVQTRGHTIQARVISHIKTPRIIDQNIILAQVSSAKKDDAILRTRCEANETIGKVKFFKKIFVIPQV